ncbi:hypothetical protein ACIOG8_15885 [Streptomyces erythrochromogenes]|uniref:hypothetical protein n=1 Tax=Streptomyces erythrochromogenes TaxID=285574 RepID=UPI003804BAA6
MRLLDFPGIGAAGSYGRDTFLSRREPVNVHTILLVLSATRAESKGASAFWDMLTEDGRQPQALASAAFVAANAFDLAKPPALSQYPGGPLPLEKLLPHAAEINGVHVYGNKCVARREDGVVVVSSIGAIRAHQLPYTRTSPRPGTGSARRCATWIRRSPAGGSRSRPGRRRPTRTTHRGDRPARASRRRAVGTRGGGTGRRPGHRAGGP